MDFQDDRTWHANARPALKTKYEGPAFGVWFWKYVRPNGDTFYACNGIGRGSGRGRTIEEAFLNWLKSQRDMLFDEMCERDCDRRLKDTKRRKAKKQTTV